MLSSEDTVQGSDAWIRARLGHISASRFADVLTKPRSGAGLSKTAERYLRDLLGELLTDRPASELKTIAMEWGSEWEPIARDAYSRANDVDVIEKGFIKHKTLSYVGGSNDGMVGEDGIIEIKCPITAAQHLLAIEEGVPEEHFPQIYGNLWITDRKWCDFISYHAHFPRHLRLVIHRVERDEEKIAEIATRVSGFQAILVDRLWTLMEGT